MAERSLDIIFFSATKTTERSINKIAEGIGLPIRYKLNLADNQKKDFPIFEKNDVLLVASPVYGGRLPIHVAENLRRLKGNNSSAIPVVVYGNRDYDDALLELSDILKETGFNIIAAGAFIGQHSIFPQAGYSRPDKSDNARLHEFGVKCAEIIERGITKPVSVNGNRPYKKYGSVPIHPEGSKDSCTKCGTCVDCCPEGAIDRSRPWETKIDKCISCGRCISICPKNNRRYKGLKYSVIEKIFCMAFSKSKEPEFFF